MVKNVMVGVVVFVIAAICYSLCWAEDYEAKLRDVRYKKAGIEANYKKELADVTRKGNADIETIKADFHAKRDERLRRLKDDQQKLKNSYESDIAPLNDEEKKLLEALAPAGSNFVKPKVRSKEK